MPWLDFIWDDDDNVPHLARHRLTPEDVAFVLQNAEPDDHDVSRSTGRPLAFGYTPGGRYICVIYEQLDAMTVYVVTAYDVEE